MKSLLSHFLRYAIGAILILMVLHPTLVSAQEEAVEPFFRLNYYSDEFESEAQSATVRFSYTNWLYDCTNAVVYWTNHVV